VQAYGTQWPSTGATVSVPEAAHDFRFGVGQIHGGAVDRSIRDSNLGLNPIVDGSNAHPAAELNEQRRKEQ